jgi:hypothetical protein
MKVSFCQVYLIAHFKTAATLDFLFFFLENSQNVYKSKVTMKVVVVFGLLVGLMSGSSYASDGPLPSYMLGKLLISDK